jgi:hypothetical protein
VSKWIMGQVLFGGVLKKKKFLRTVSRHAVIDVLCDCGKKVKIHFGSDG